MEPEQVAGYDGYLGLKPTWAGRGMTRWATAEEAEASWEQSIVVAGIARSSLLWWRAGEPDIGSDVPGGGAV